MWRGCKLVRIVLWRNRFRHVEFHIITHEHSRSCKERRIKSFWFWMRPVHYYWIDGMQSCCNFWQFLHYNYHITVRKRFHVSVECKSAMYEQFYLGSSRVRVNFMKIQWIIVKHKGRRHAFSPVDRLVIHRRIFLERNSNLTEWTLKQSCILNRMIIFMQLSVV